MRTYEDISPVFTVSWLALHTSPSEVGSIVLPRGGAGPALLSVAAGVRGSLLTSGPSLPSASGTDGQVCVEEHLSPAHAAT